MIIIDGVTKTDLIFVAAGIFIGLVIIVILANQIGCPEEIEYTNGTGGIQCTIAAVVPDMQDFISATARNKNEVVISDEQN